MAESLMELGAFSISLAVKDIKAGSPANSGDTVSFMAGLFIVILAGIAAGTIGEIAKAIARRGASPSEVAGLKQQLEEQAAALEDAQTTLANQSTQLAELQERLDFAERVLAQARDRSALGAGETRGMDR